MRLNIRVRVLPVLVLVCFLCFAVRLGEFWTGVSHMGNAQAQEKVNAEPPPMPKDAKIAETAPKTEEHAKTDEKSAGKDDAKAEGEHKGPELPALGSGEKVQWRDSSEDQADCSDAEGKLNQDLSKRREELDKESRELSTRKALLSVAQQELDQKVGEMTTLRNQIQGMMSTLSDQEKARMQSLVKIYETMKPADAARIFNTLDMDVLIEVMSMMKEAKSAPVLAAMDSERAKSVTVMLAQQKKLPDLPQAGQ
jgi:flagellar motility protein MotE (MotC chaperone)